MKTYSLAELLLNHQDLCKEWLPSGSGFDAGTEIRVATTYKIILKADFHHMDENGFYDGWTEHNVTAIPTFHGNDIKVSGKDRNQIKEYIAETFQYALFGQKYALTYNQETKEFKVFPVNIKEG